MNKQTAWRFYLSSPEAWEGMLAACREARWSIDLEQFILNDDQVGERFVEVFCERARAGVRVRVICDAGGSFGFFRSSAVARLREAGVQVVPFNTLLPGSFYNHTIWFFRDHQKLLVVDNEIGFTGGICLASEMRTWRETHVQLTGPVVAEMVQQFEAMWRRAHKRRAGRMVAPNIKSERFFYLTSAPLPHARRLYHRIIAALRSSERTIDLTTPYFVPDHRMLRVLELAAHRGVQVRLLVPRASDHFLVDLAGQSHFESLLKRGVQIYQYFGRMIHSKTIIVDGMWSTVGSFNYDYLSAYYNFEANIVSTDPQFAAELTRQFTADLAQAVPVERKQWLNRPWRRQLGELLVRPLRPFL